MSNGKYIDLDRTFSEISGELEFDENSYETYLGFGSSQSTRWDDIIAQQRVIILAEAGAGKTIEIRSITQKLRNEAKSAFFFRLEHLNTDFEDAFDIGDYAEFQAWLSSSQECWIFLDSVDEARLNGPKQFEKAILKLANRLGEAKQRAHIFITSRMSEWRSSTDLSLIKEKLRITKNVEAESDVDPFENISFEKVSGSSIIQEKSNEEIVIPTVYALNPLDGNQIKVFSKAMGVSDTDAFSAEITKAEAEIFSSRPQDLEELIDFWKKEKRIGNRSELLENSLNNKLDERDPERASANPLCRDDAEYGAEMIAAAVTLQQKSRILTADIERLKDGIDVHSILSDWDDGKIKAILNRPIFDQAVYGAVQFHHRTVREYLTARWILRLLRDGKSRYKIEQLFFRTQYGCDVLVPTMRPILSWVVLSDDKICKRTANIAPEVFLEGGDPASLSTDVRKNLLKHFCKHYFENEDHMASFDIAGVRRFAHKDLGSTINTLLTKYSSNKKICHLLLQMIWQADIRKCMRKVLTICLNSKVDIYTMIYGVRAVRAAGSDKDITQFINYIYKSKAKLSHRVISEIISEFAPSKLSAEQVVQLVSKLPPENKYEYYSLQNTLEKYVNRCPVEQLYTFAKYILPLLKKSPLIERRFFNVSKANAWLLGCAIRASERLASCRHKDSLTKDVVAIISLSQSAHFYNELHIPKHNLKEIVSTWHELNYVLFWHDVNRQRKNVNKPERVINWRVVGCFNNYWSFSDKNLMAILSDIKGKKLIDDRLVALSLAFQVYIENGKKTIWLEQLKELTKGNKKLAQSLHVLLHPAPMSEQEKKYLRQDADYKRKQQKQERKTEKLHADWAKWLKGNTHVLRDVSVAKKGSIWHANEYLMNFLRELNDEKNCWAHGRWQALIPKFGEKVATSFRDGAINYWRLYKPKLRSEDETRYNNVPHPLVFGLTGLEVESGYISDWPNNLTSKEATLACRYAIRELNGFSEWLPRLHAAFPDEVERVLLKEIEWEFKYYDDKEPCHHVLSSIYFHASWIKPKISESLLKLLTKYAPKHDDTVRHAIEIVLSNPNIDNIKLIDLAKLGVSDPSDRFRRHLWFSLWISIDSSYAIKALAKYIKRIKEKNKATQFAMSFIGELLENRQDSCFREYRHYMKPDILCELYMLMHKYIRIEDDINRSGTGTYSPTLRDDAQRARDNIFNLLNSIPGKETYLALKYIYENHPNDKSPKWIRRNMELRAETDSDLSKWNPEDISAFASEAEHKPNNHRELFGLLISRLQDLKMDLEHGDSSIASLIIQSSLEKEHRIYVGSWLRDMSRTRYSVPQEEEFADGKKPDIRIHGAGLDAPIPIEMKVADKWSGSDLFERLENQLIGNYLRDPRSNFGVYLLVNRGVERKRWENPQTSKRLTFLKLISNLQDFANALVAHKEGIYEVMVVGIDLTLRASADRN